MASGALARGLTALLLASLGTVACGRRAGEITAAWNIEPSPPSVGAATLVRVRLAHEDGTPVHGAKLTLEGHMSHPGMTPIVAEVSDRGGGAYESRIHLSMAGDWVFVLTGELASGHRVTKHVAVPSVEER